MGKTAFLFLWWLLLLPALAESQGVGPGAPPWPLCGRSLLPPDAGPARRALSGRSGFYPLAIQEDSLGEQRTLNARDLSNNSFHTVTATLKAKGKHCYVYLDNAASLAQTDLDSVAAEFDRVIYPRVTRVFGKEPRPPDDVDGDTLITILIYDIRDGLSGTGTFVAGFFDPTNQGPGPNSNQREMIYMDVKLVQGRQRNLPLFFGTMAHEFQHLIHYYYDPAEADWIDEGCAEYAHFISGYGIPTTPLSLFLDDPNNDLTLFSNQLSDYIQSFLFILYLTERFDQDLIKALVTDSRSSITGINGVLADRGSSLRFADLFQDWTVANFLDDPSLADGRFGYQAITLPPAKTSPPDPFFILPDSTVTGSSTVQPWAARYVQFDNSTGMTLEVVRNSTGLTGRVIRLGALLATQVETLAFDNSSQTAIWQENDRYNKTVLVVAVVSLFQQTFGYTGTGPAPTAISTLLDAVPDHYTLEQNWPNPFNPQTTIQYSLGRFTRQATILTIYNLLGQPVRVLVNEIQTPGVYQVNWDGKDENGRALTSGVFIYHLRSGPFAASKSMVLLR